jgi:NADH-quinone oxidoreductase subunit N
LYVFSAAIEQGHYMLAIVGMLNSAVAAYYYLRVIVTLYMTKPEGEAVEIIKPPGYQVALVFSSIVILIIGLMPEPLLGLLSRSVP